MAIVWPGHRPQNVRPQNDGWRARGRVQWHVQNEQVPKPELEDEPPKMVQGWDGFNNRADHFDVDAMLKARELRGQVWLGRAVFYKFYQFEWDIDGVGPDQVLYEGTGVVVGYDAILDKYLVQDHVDRKRYYIQKGTMILLENRE